MPGKCMSKSVTCIIEIVGYSPQVLPLPCHLKLSNCEFASMHAAAYFQTIIFYNMDRGFD